MARRREREREVTNQGVRSGPLTRDVNAAVRVEQAIQLRCRKLPYAEIAQRCGYGSAQAAQKAVMRELERRIHRAVDQLRSEEAEMYDDLQRAVYPLAAPQGENQKVNLFAIDRVLAISAARRALLGLDAQRDATPALPTIIEVAMPLAAAIRGQMAPEQAAIVQALDAQEAMEDAARDGSSD